MGVTLDDAVEIYRAGGCEQCNDMGYWGRTGIYELIACDETLCGMIHDNASEAKMEAYARETFPSIRQDGWRRVMAGETTIEEVLRVSTEG